MAVRSVCYLYFALILCLSVLIVNCKVEYDADPVSLSNIQQFPSIFLKNELRGNSEHMTASLNKYLDQLMPLVNAAIKTPILIPDYNVSLHTDIAFIVPLFGSLSFYNGQVKDVGTISRSSDAPVTYDDEVLSFALTVAVKDVVFAGDFVADLESLGTSGSLSGSMDQITLDVHFTLDVKHLKAKLNRFYLQAGEVDLQVDILPGLNWLLNSLIEVLIYIIKWPLLSIISGEARDYIQQLLDNYTNMLQ